MQISKDYLKPQKRDPHLHSPNHALADELMNKLGDTKHFGFYLRMAGKYNHGFLRKLAGEVLEQKAKNPGALFAFLIKKHNQEKSAQDGPENSSNT
jgi:hypothetical protein